jgi:serine/threonine-protein kinase
MVSINDAQKVFRLEENWRPLSYIENDFENQGETVIDHVTGLLWQRSGSDESLTYQKAQAYIENLNRERFAGYADWRLPTVEELMSLLEPEKQSNEFYINPIFDKRQWCSWSADTISTLWSRIFSSGSSGSPGSAWYVGFGPGDVGWGRFVDTVYVRAVRA